MATFIFCVSGVDAVVCAGFWAGGGLTLVRSLRAKANAGILPAPASKLAGDPVRFAQNDREKVKGKVPDARYALNLPLRKAG